MGKNRSTYGPDGHHGADRCTRKDFEGGRSTYPVDLVPALVHHRLVLKLALPPEQRRGEGVEGVHAAERRHRERGLVQLSGVGVPRLHLVVDDEVHLARVVGDDLAREGGETRERGRGRKGRMDKFSGRASS